MTDISADVALLSDLNLLYYKFYTCTKVGEWFNNHRLKEIYFRAV